MKYAYLETNRSLKVMRKQNGVRSNKLDKNRIFVGT